MRNTTWYMFGGMLLLVCLLVFAGIVKGMTVIPIFGFGIMLVLALDEAMKPIPNALIFRHPDNGLGADLTKHKPEQNQMPHPFPYAWWGLKKVPLYYWYEDRVEKEIEVADLPRVQDADVKPNFCACGFQAKNERLFEAHLKWNPKATSVSEDDFHRQHQPVTAAYQKQAAVAVATAIVQDKPATKVEYVIKPYEPVPILFRKLKIGNEEIVVSMSPNALWDQCDWAAAMRFRTPPANKTAENVKLGSAIAIIGICAVLIILILGS